MITILVSALLSAPPVTVQVEGQGYLRFTREGRTVYARSASLNSLRGRLAYSGAFVLPSIPVAEGAEFSVSRDGTVSVSNRSVGKLVLAKFPEGLPLVESGAFFTSTVRPQLGSAGAQGLGWIEGTKTTARPIVASASSSQISVRLESVVDSKTFTLGDIAEFHLPLAVQTQLSAIVVGDTPPIGIDRKVDRDRILVRLRVSGFDPSTYSIDVPEGALVRRPSQKVEHEQLFAAAMAALREQVGAQAQIADLNPMPPLVVGLGTVTLNPTNPTVSSGKANIRVEVLVNGSLATSRTLQLSIANSITLPKVGTMVTVKAHSRGVNVQFTAKVTAARSADQIEILTPEGEKLLGTLVAPGIVEIRL